jgi:hypothetical protein
MDINAKIVGIFCCSFRGDCIVWANKSAVPEHMTVRIDSSRCGQEFAGMMFIRLMKLIAGSVLDAPLRFMFQTPLAILPLIHPSWACAR